MMDRAIREKLTKREYDSISGNRVFASRLTDDLRAVCADRHLALRYSPEGIAAGRNEPSAANTARRNRFPAARNYGFKTV